MASIQILRTESADILQSIFSRYEDIVAEAGVYQSVILDMRGLLLLQAVRKAAAESSDAAAPARAAEAWLMSNVGSLDNGVRRAAIATLALRLRPQSLGLPTDMLALYPQMHERLARALSTLADYDPSFFPKDIALAAGTTMPAGGLSITIPLPGARGGFRSRLRQTAALFVRQWHQHGADEALALLFETGVGRWMEFHVDERNLRDFNPAGFRRMYHRLAALMRARPELAGVYGASWLYDPAVSHVSPKLAFCFTVPLEAGGKSIRLREDPVQTAFAVARSATRLKLWEAGTYRPVCYAMYWTRRDLLAWAEQDAG